jgi:hypothetical protein
VNSLSLPLVQKTPVRSVPVANGGTGATTLTGYLLGAGASAVTASATIPGSAISGNIAGNAASATNVTGTVAVANGGTGATTLTGYLLGAGASAVTASATIPGSAITGNIAGSAASATNVTGTVAVANGGTGANTLTGYLLGSGTGAFTASTTIPGSAISGNIAGNSANAANVTGTVAIANGGTGGTTAAVAINNLLPAQSAGIAGDVLSTSGTTASWSAPTTGTVTSVTGTSPITVTGTTTPAITLGTVPVAKGGTGATTLTGYLLGNGATNPVTATAVIPVASGGTGATSYTQGQILFGTGATTAIASSSSLFWDNVNLRLGIGTSSPGYPIVVATSVNGNIGSYGYLNSSAPTGTASGTGNISIDVVGRVVAQEVDANSDARIKNIIGPSDTALDLATLEELNITNYRYIDVVTKGSQPKIGVIAQQVERVYPGAVRTLSDFIPSVYAMADHVSYDDAARQLTVGMPESHGLVVGDMVRIITDAGNVDKRVETVIDDRTFVLSDVEKDSSKVFVFGKRVDDFRVVDYDQLFSMNIGATQQLAIENQALMKENAAIIAENGAIKARLAALEHAVEELQKHN